MSDQPTKKLYDEMDLRIFGEQGQHKCDQNCDDPIEGCIVVKRLVVALAYHSHLDVQNDKNSQEIFLAFIKDVYPHILEDYAHLVKKHTNLEAINNALRAKKVFGVCEASKCHCTARHQSRETTKPSEQSMDAIVQFYSQLMDSLHFYLLHLFECGLRTPKVTPNDDDNDDKKEDHGQYFDKKFSRVSRMVNERHHIRLSFGRFKTNTKFNIQAAATADESSNSVYMDEVVRYLLYSEVEEDTIRQFAQFISSHQYDLDSMPEDIKQASQGNIAVNIGDEEVIKAIAEFIRASELRSSSFNIGLTFYYWPKYEKMDVFDANIAEYKGSDGSKCEEVFSTWGPDLKSSYKHANENRGWWYLYVYKELNNEMHEQEMIKKGQLVTSCRRNGIGYLFNVSQQYVRDTSIHNGNSNNNTNNSNHD